MSPEVISKMENIIGKVVPMFSDFKVLLPMLVVVDV